MRARRKAIWATVVGYATSVFLCASLLAQDKTQREQKKQKQQSLTLPRAPTWLVLVEEENPWTGSNGPTLVLYADGTVIYWKRSQTGPGYFSAKLTEEETRQFLEAVDIPQAPFQMSRAVLGVPGMPEPPVTMSSDAAWTRISIFQNGKGRKSWSLLGGLRHSAHVSPGSETYAESRALDFLALYEHSRAIEWIPERFEVWLLPKKSGTLPALPWPAGWPGIHDAEKFPENGYLLRLERARYREVDEFLATRKLGQGVLIDGKEWYVSVSFSLPPLYTVPQVNPPGKEEKQE